METNKELQTSGAPIGKPATPPRFFNRLASRFKGNRSALIAALILLAILSMSVFAPLLAPYNPAKGMLVERLKGPTLQKSASGGFPHIFGTDQQGRDVFSRIIYGGRVSLSVAFIVCGIAGTVGIVFGLIAGYAGGWTDMIMMRVVDIQSSFPGLIVALTFVMVLGPGQKNLIIALLINGWMIFARMARSQVLVIRESAMVESARAIGVGSIAVLFRHVLPNAVSPLITTFVLELAHMINAEANMSFLGFGIQPPASSWGLMIAEGRNYIASSWWLVTFPGLIIGATVLCLNIVGNWIREEFDPLSRKH